MNDTTRKTAAVRVMAAALFLHVAALGSRCAENSAADDGLRPPTAVADGDFAGPAPFRFGDPAFAAPVDPKQRQIATDECRDVFANVPPARVLPPPGPISAPPTGSGYYSLCDWLAGCWREKPPKSPYPRFGGMPPSFFDADFRYIDDPAIGPQESSDALKRIRLGEEWMVSTGGQVWWRHMQEVNSRLTGRTNSYDLYRTRAFGDLWYRDEFRTYIEFIDARSFAPNLPPLPTDANHADILNLFVDVKAAEIAGKPAYVRVGRQEMLFGSQRLVTTLDWANTRRTFQGVRAFRAGDKFDVDAFWTQPVIPNTDELDWADTGQNFAGLWATYRPRARNFIDFYYLFRNDSSPADGTPAYDLNTFGSRYAGDHDNWLWDVETMIQFGRRGGQDVLAGAVTTGGGYEFAGAPMKPRLWLYYDWASGDHSPGSGMFNTFNSLFPFGHNYLGWVDLVGRQNIHDVNLHLYLYPTNWITTWIQFHHFQLASRRDALYSPGGAPLRRDASGSSGRHVGEELDFVLNFHLGNRQDILVGHSLLFPGKFLRETGPSRAPQLTYVQYSVRW